MSRTGKAEDVTVRVALNVRLSPAKWSATERAADLVPTNGV
jgi:hypothetical protein